MKVGKVGVVRHARATTTAVVIVNSSDIGPNSSAAVAIEQNNAQSVAAEQPIDAPSREVHPVAPIDDSIFGNMHLVTTTLNAHSKMNNKWWLPPGNTDFASLVGGADHAPRSNLDSNLTNVVDEPSGYQQPNPSFVYLEKVKPLCRGSNDGPYPAAPVSNPKSMLFTDLLLVMLCCVTPVHVLFIMLACTYAHVWHAPS